MQAGAQKKVILLSFMKFRMQVQQRQTPTWPMFLAIEIQTDCSIIINARELIIKYSAGVKLLSAFFIKILFNSEIF